MRVRFKLLGCCLLLAGLTAAFASTKAVAQKTRPMWEEARAAQIKAARREGIPITPADLRTPDVQADQNAATYMAKIRELDQASPVSREEITALEAMYMYAPTPDQVERGRRALEEHHERSLLIRRMAQCPFYVEPADFLDIDGTPVPDTFPRNAQFRDYARWLVYESMLLLQDGKPLEAVQTDALVFHVAWLAGSQGSLISMLVGNAIDGMGLGALRSILYHDGDKAAVAEAVGQTIDKWRGPPTLGLALRGEVVFVLAMTELQRHMTPEKLMSDPGDASTMPFEKTKEYRLWTKKYGYPTDPKLAVARLLDMNDAHYLAWIRRILPLADLPYPEALAGLTAISREADKHVADPDYSLAVISIGMWSNLPVTQARLQARAEMVRTAAALLTWKTRHGHFPDSLAECLHPTPLDPFDLHALRYRKEAEGFVLYSVGEHGKFDGGRLGRKPHGNEYLFRYPRPVY